jgi:oligopeptide/dipeptide ABC transporter ATP-binding protein
MTSIIRAENLSVGFPIRGGLFQSIRSEVKAVNDVSFEVVEGKTLGVVGESGCGKTSLGRALVRLYEPTQGKIFFRDQDITHLSSYEMRSFRKEIQMIFQDPYASLNPRMSVKQILEEPFRLDPSCSKEEREDRLLKLLDIVGMDTSVLERYPHEFSGGQRQRISIARTLILRPKLIIADEPVSALDVSIQAQILNLLKELQEKFELTYIFISHDLGVVRYVADVVLVMYLGNIVEEAPVEILFETPKHPYTKALLDAIPKADPRRREKKNILLGDLPSPMNPPSGCVFHTRCPLADSNCKIKKPTLNRQSNNASHKVACHKV